MVEVAAAGICGSDLHVAAWSPAYAFMTPALPVTLGHEFAGTVVALGPGATTPEPGTRVVVMPSVTCGTCAGCRRGGPDACTSRTGLGMTRNGAFARMVAVPAANCVAIPDTMSFALAALTEPLTVSWEAVRRGSVGPGSRILVMGPGTIGQGVALLARHAGAAQVVVTGFRDAARLEVLRSMGFTATIDMAEAGARDRLRDAARGGFDVVIEATGRPSTIADGLALLASGGILVVSGIHDAPAEFDATTLVRRNLQIRGSYRAPRAVWPAVVDLLAADPAGFAPMITRRVGLAEAPDAFADRKSVV